MSMTRIKAEIVADSVSPHGHRITSFLLTFPRIILAEFNTHRMFSRNTASSRAIPFEKMVGSVMDDPFIPIAWQKDHKGMQGTQYLNDEEFIVGDDPRPWNAKAALRFDWLQARDKAVEAAKSLHSKGVTKQLCNRLLEPFMWTTVLCTATEFENFFELRCPQYEYIGQMSGVDRVYKSRKQWLEDLSWNRTDDPPTVDVPESEIDWLRVNRGQAEIHMMALAEAMWDAYNESQPKELKEGEWHIPFKSGIHCVDWRELTGDPLIVNAEQHDELLDLFEIKIATAQCARTSYTVPGTGKISYARDIELHDNLLKMKHMSPFEHCARVMTKAELWMNSLNTQNMHESDSTSLKGKETPGVCRNFKGFIQYRHFVEK